MPQGEIVTTTKYPEEGSSPAIEDSHQEQNSTGDPNAPESGTGSIDLLEYLRLSPTARTPTPARETRGRRLTLSRSMGYAEALQLAAARNKNTSIIRMGRAGRRSSFFEDLFDWAENTFGDDDDQPPSSLHNSLLFIRQSVTTTEAKLRRFSQDYLMYNLTLTSAYITFSLLSGVTLAYLIHCVLSSHGQNRDRDFQSNFDTAGTTSNISSNLTYFWQYDRLNSDITHLLEYQVDLQCSRCRAELEASTEYKLKNEEYIERIAVLEDEISSLRQQSSERLAKKQQNLKALIRAVATFKQEHFCIQETTLYQFLSFGLSTGWVGGLAFYFFRRYFAKNN